MPHHQNHRAGRTGGFTALLLLTLTGGGGAAYAQRPMEEVCRKFPELLTCKTPMLVRPMGRTFRPPAQQAQAVRGPRPVVQFAGLPVTPPAGAARLRFFSAGAAVAAGFNVKAWRDGGALKGMVSQLEAAGMPAGRSGMVAAVLSMMEEVDQVWMMIDGVQPGVKATKAAATAGTKPPDPVFLLTGRFSNPMWEQMLAGEEPLVGTKAILVGKPAAIAAARRRLRLPAAPGKLALEAAQLSTDADFWLAAVPRLLPAPRASTTTADPASMAWSAVERFSLTVASRTERFQAEARLVTTTPQAAGQVMALYRLVEGQMQQQAGQARARSEDALAAREKEALELAETVARSVTAEQEGTTLRFKVSMDAADLQKLAQQRFTGSWLGGGTVARGGGKAASSGSGPKVVIQGLESGPREIPLR